MLPEKVAFFGCMTITSGFVAIRLLHRVPIPEQVIVWQFFAMMLIVPCLFLSISGKITNDSVTIRLEMKRSTERGNFKVWKRVVRSLKPFGVSVGPIRAVRHNGFPAYLENVISGLTTVLVNYPEVV